LRIEEWGRATGQAGFDYGPHGIPVPVRGLFVLEDAHKTRQKFVPSSRYAPIGATIHSSAELLPSKTAPHQL